MRSLTSVMVGVLLPFVVACGGTVVVPDPCEDSAPVGELRVLIAPPESFGGTIVQVGATLELSAEVRPVAGAGTNVSFGGCTDYYGPALSATITWRSSNTTVATIDVQGVVTGRAIGLAIVTARDATRGVEANREIRVQAQ